MSDKSVGLRIVCSALKMINKDIILVGVRHWDEAMREQAKRYNFEKEDFYFDQSIQGFLANDFKFYDRKEAWLIADKAGQIIRKVSVEGTLYSENLY